jgi:hypothetical protein
MSSLIFLPCTKCYKSNAKRLHRIFTLSRSTRKKGRKIFSCFDGVQYTVLLVVPGYFVVYCTVTGLEGFHPRSQAEPVSKITGLHLQ